MTRFPLEIEHQQPKRRKRRASFYWMLLLEALRLAAMLAIGCALVGAAAVILDWIGVMVF